MIVKKATQVGNKLIRARAVEITNLQSVSTKKVVRDLIDSMRHHELVGMAAPQIGKSVRIFVTEIKKTKLRKGDSVKNEDPLRVFINPRLVLSSKKQSKGWEGCGSVASANLFGMVKRPSSVVVDAWNLQGEKFRLKADRLLSRVIQHEMDHLNGIVFSDKADTKTYMSRNEYLKLRARKL